MRHHPHPAEDYYYPPQPRQAVQNGQSCRHALAPGRTDDLKGGQEQGQPAQNKPMLGIGHESGEGGEEGHGQADTDGPRGPEAQ